MAPPPPARPSSSDTSFFSKPRMNKPGASIAAPVAVTTRLVAVQRPPNPTDGVLQVKARSATPTSSSSTPAPETLPKRKAVGLDAVLPHPKRQRLLSPATSGRSQSQTRSRASSTTPASLHPGPSRSSSLARSSLAKEDDFANRSRSGSAVPAPAPLPPRDCWTEEDGRPGPDLLSSESVVSDLMKTYKAYFTNPDDVSDHSWNPHPTEYPSVDLEYPNAGASEKFILLAPKDPEHYNPIICLRTTLYTIIKHYLTPAQQELFGTLPSTLFPNENDRPPGIYPNAPDIVVYDPVSSPPSFAITPPPASPSPSASSSDSSSPSVFSAASSTSSISSLSSISALSHHACVSPTGFATINYLKLLERAINTHNGPLFIQVMDAINAILRCLKYPPVPSDPFEPASPNNLCEMVRTWSNIPPEVVARIAEETNQRAVGPHAVQLNTYTPFSSNVYGEMWPPLIQQIIKDTRLSKDSLFMDLGSGVGNVVLHTCAQTGCRGYGIEMQPIPARVARSHLEQFRMRCRMWGVSMGEAELQEGDMLQSARVDELIKQADVVLVNNKVFDETLNERLRPKFLDLKEGAFVVSLKPFVSSTRLTERNLDDVSAFFQVTEGKYLPGSVSWADTGGSYFIHRVDREWYADTKQRLESRSASARAPSRTTRSHARR